MWEDPEKRRMVECYIDDSVYREKIVNKIVEVKMWNE